MAHCWQGCCVPMEHHFVMDGVMDAAAARAFLLSVPGRSAGGGCGHHAEAELRARSGTMGR